jgi:hypothetical protein
LYVPDFSVTDTDFAPPLNVGVAPTFSPEEDSIVTLCGSGDLFVKSTETLPAFALSDFVLYASWPSGLASRLSFSDPPDGAGVADLAELVVGAAVELLVVGAAAELVVGACAAVLAEEELEEELPQPASASRAAASANAEIENTERFVA